MTTLSRNENTVVPLPGGKVLHVMGLPQSDGVAYRLNQALGGTNSLQSWAISGGSTVTVGPYGDDENILVACEIGGIDLAVEAFTGGGAGGGAVDSVNMKVGAVELTAADVGAVPAGYAIAGVHFDGANSSLACAAFSCVDSPTHSFSFWYRTVAAPQGGGYLFTVDPLGDYTLAVGLAITNQMDFYAQEASGGANFDSVLNTSTADSRWHHMMGTIETDAVAGTKKAVFYADDVEATLNSGSDTAGSFVPPVNGRFVCLGDDSAGSGEVFDIADFWYAPGYSMIENGVIPIGTRRKFITADKNPVNLGTQGATPTGSRPAIFLHRAEGADVTTFADNLGSGGAFAIVGTITAAEGSPGGSAPDTGFANPMTAAGDLIVGGTDGAATRLANPGAGTFNLQSIDGVLTWVAP
jgi:hypothetical protein